MILGRFRLRAIALVAAYALALQGLLSAFGPVAAALPSGILCSGQAMDGPADAPGEPSCTAACAMLGGVAGPLPPGAVIARQRARAAHQPMRAVAAFVNAPRGLQTARAPPFV